MTTHKTTGLALLLAIPAALGAASNAAAASFFTDEATFLAAAGGGLATESFETATEAGTTVTFPGGTFSCAGTSFCPSFFGVSTFTALDGLQSVYFATPDTATFAFDAPITAFGISIGGAGDVAPITLTLTTSGGASAPVLSDHSSLASLFEEGDVRFGGVIDPLGFTSVTFSGSNSGDGIFFDRMYTGTGTAVIPLPGALPLALGAFAMMAGLGLQRRRHAV